MTDDHALRRAMRAQVPAGPVQAETDAEARRHVLKIVRAWDETAHPPGMTAVREQIGDELTASDDRWARLAATAVVEYAELDAMVRAQLGLPEHTG